MNEQIKSMSRSVKVAIVFLLLLYVAMCFMVPIFGLVLGIGAGTILSIIRVWYYLTYGD